MKQKCISSQKAFPWFLFRDIMNTPVIQAARPHYQRMKDPGQRWEFSKCCATNNIFYHMVSQLFWSVFFKSEFWRQKSYTHETELWFDSCCLNGKKLEKVSYCLHTMHRFCLTAVILILQSNDHSNTIILWMTLKTRSCFIVLNAN